MMRDYPIPAWRVTLDGKDLTETLRPRLLSLTLTESRGEEADELSVQIHDHDGRMAIPREGAVLRVAIGWQGEGLVDKGSYTVDEVEHSGTPDIISIRARSANLTRAMRTRAERSYHATTLGDVLGQIAGRHGLQVRLDPALAARAVPHLDQTNESDVHLLTRLARRHDAVATIKAGTLLFAPIGKGQTASGTPLPDASLTRRAGDKHRYSVPARDNYSGARATWSDRQGARQRDVLAGDGNNARRLPHTYHSEQEASEQAESAHRRAQRAKATFSLTLALGDASLYPEQRLRVRGFKPEIDAIDWLIAKTTHTLTGSAGFTTQVEMEMGLGVGSADDDAS